MVLKKKDKIWKRLMKDKNLKPRNMHLWWELYDKYNEDMEKLMVMSFRTRDCMKIDTRMFSLKLTTAAKGTTSGGGTSNISARHVMQCWMRRSFRRMLWID